MPRLEIRQGPPKQSEWTSRDDFFAQLNNYIASPERMDAILITIPHEYGGQNISEEIRRRTAKIALAGAFVVKHFGERFGFSTSTEFLWDSSRKLYQPDSPPVQTYYTAFTPEESRSLGSTGHAVPLLLYKHRLLTNEDLDALTPTQRKKVKIPSVKLIFDVGGIVNAFLNGESELQKMVQAGEINQSEIAGIKNGIYAHLFVDHQGSAMQELAHAIDFLLHRKTKKGTSEIIEEIKTYRTYRRSLTFSQAEYASSYTDHPFEIEAERWEALFLKLYYPDSPRHRQIQVTQEERKSRRGTI